MLGQLAAHCRLGALISRQQVLYLAALNGSCPSSKVHVGLLSLSKDSALQRHNSQYHTSCSSSTSEQPPQQPSSQPAETPSAPDGNREAASPQSSADEAKAADSAAQQHQQQAESSLKGFATLPARSTSTGYAETMLVDEIQGFDGDVAQSSVVPSLPEETLRIQLRQEVKQLEETVQIDAYTLSRSLGGGDIGPSSFAAAAAPGPQQQQQQQRRQPQLTAADKETLEKLIGIMTKDGKKSRARRQLLDAMHIIKEQLAQGKNTA